MLAVNHGALGLRTVLDNRNTQFEQFAHIDALPKQVNRYDGADVQPGHIVHQHQACLWVDIHKNRNVAGFFDRHGGRRVRQGRNRNSRWFGEFQRLLASLPGARLHETIPNFHNTRSRLERLKQAVAADAKGRLAEVKTEWDFIQRREDIVDRLLDLWTKGEIPERVTHNDTKLNNVMIDDATETGVCVVDLDTVMPGLALYDFGDMVRTATSPALEDEPDVSKVRMQMPMFEALVSGYLSSARSFLNEAEIAHLAFSGKLITLEIGIRFLTDYLEGDVYFKIKHPTHNLDRLRTQLALVKSIEDQEEAMKDFVRKASK